MALPAAAFPPASLQLPHPWAIPRAIATHSRPDVPCSTPWDPGLWRWWVLPCLMTPGSALWAANEFRNDPGNRKDFQLIKWLKRKTQPYAAVWACRSYVGPFMKLSVPCLACVWLQLEGWRGFTQLTPLLVALQGLSVAAEEPSIYLVGISVLPSRAVLSRWAATGFSCY